MAGGMDSQLGLQILKVDQYCFYIVCVFQAKVMAKFYWGDPKEKLVKAVVEIPLDALIMGSRGFGTFKR
jgi:hypothetical protein